MDKMRSQGIGFDITTGSKKVTIRLDRKGSKAALVYRAAANRTSTTMPPFAVPQGHKSHELSEIAVAGRSQHEVEVIGHETEGKHLDAGLVERLENAPNKRQVVRGVIKQTHPANSAVHHVEGKSS